MRQIIVTGGGTGIGYAIAEHFATAGDVVTITGRRRDVLDAAAAALGVTALPFDAADPEAVAAAAAQLPGHVDVLVNNAGGNTDFDRPHRTTWPRSPPGGKPTCEPTCSPRFW